MRMSNSFFFVCSFSRFSFSFWFEWISYVYACFIIFILFIFFSALLLFFLLFFVHFFSVIPSLTFSHSVYHGFFIPQNWYWLWYPHRHSNHTKAQRVPHIFVNQQNEKTFFWTNSKKENKKENRFRFLLFFARFLHLSLVADCQRFHQITSISCFVQHSIYFLFLFFLFLFKEKIVKKRKANKTFHIFNIIEYKYVHIIENVCVRIDIFEQTFAVSVFFFLCFFFILLFTYSHDDNTQRRKWQMTLTWVLMCALQYNIRPETMFPSLFFPTRKMFWKNRRRTFNMNKEERKKEKNSQMKSNNTSE